MILTMIQMFLQTVWASILALGWIKVGVAVLVIAILTRVQSLLGLLATVLFIAYLAGWI